MQTIIDYITSNYIEFTGFLFGIAYVILAAYQNIWCWITGIINVGLYVMVYFSAALYGEALLHVIYLLMGFYGLYQWKYGGKGEKKLTISRLKLKTGLFLIVFSAGMAILSGYALSWTDTDVPYSDGLATALGITATWMTARKILENWLAWIGANIYCCGLYYYKGLYILLINYIVLSLIAIVGYYKWKKDYQKQAVTS